MRAPSRPLAEVLPNIFEQDYEVVSRSMGYSERTVHTGRYTAHRVGVKYGVDIVRVKPRVPEPLDRRHAGKGILSQKISEAKRGKAQ